MATRSERFELRIDGEQLDRVDTWAAEQPERLTRAEAFRRLIDLGLAAGSQRAVRFSDGEKMLILMMGDLFKRLDVQGESNPDFLAQVIYGGHYWAPKWEMQGVFHDHVDNPADLEYVVHILDMWSFLEEAYAKFTPEQRIQVTAEVGPWATDIAFDGFDGNEEASQYSIARFLINDMNRFARFKGRDLNSHSPTEATYRSMYEIFEKIRPTLIGHGLNVQQVVKILKA